MPEHQMLLQALLVPQMQGMVLMSVTSTQLQHQSLMQGSQQRWQHC
jgi:hypothetical protein